MSDAKVSGLTSAATLTGAERFPVTQSNQSKAATAAQLLSSSLFTQTGTGAVARSINSKFGDIVSVRDFGAVGDGVTDDTAAISAAIAACLAASGLPALYAPGGTYLVTSQLTSIPGQFTLYGAGRQQTTFLFRPSADNVACFKVSNGSSQVINVFMRDFGIKSDDTTHIKIGLDLYDLTTCEFSNLYIYGTGTGTPSAPYFSGGTGSIGVRFHGRDTVSLHHSEIVADIPRLFAANPNTAADIGEDADHFNFYSNYLLAKGNYITSVANGLGIENVSFENEAWVGGTGGFKYNDTRAAPTVYAHDINFKNIRYEQCQDANGYAFNFASTFRIGSLGFDSILIASGSQGITIDRVLSLTLARVTAAVTAGKISLTVTTPDSDSVINMIGCIWGSGTTFTLTNYTASMIEAFNVASYAGPSTATYQNVTSQAGTTAKLAGVTSTVVPTLSAYVGSGSGGGDRFKIIPNASGNGSAITSRDDGDTVFRPFIINGTYLGSLNKIYPGTDGGALQTASGLYAGTGVPNNANGANGDIYFRSDGGAGTTIYQRRAGAWVGIV